ncbi:MAG: CPBP family intramembrane metalloprotease [Clostridiales bacterium]|nr:CPBP family intramembrane metalloprotease [Clostridiales bacterium]
MSKKVILQSSITLILFFLINWGLWEIFVRQGMDESWASFTVYTVLIAVIKLKWKKKILDEWCEFKAEIKNWKIVFIELLAWLAVAIVLAYIFQYIANGAFETENTETVGNMVDKIPPVLSGVMIAVFTPFIEEITFRKSLIGSVDKENKVGIIITMILSVLLFDCIHLFRWQEFFYYLPLSVALTLFYVKHNRNIYASIMMHAAMNLPGVILMMIGVM